MLRSSCRLWINPAVSRPSSLVQPLRPLFGKGYHCSHSKYSNLSSFSSKLYSTAAPTTPPKERAWKWIVFPSALFLGGYLLGNIQEGGNRDDRFETSKLYATKSTSEIAFAWLILKLCSYDFIVSHGPKLLQWAQDYHLGGIANFVMKRTFFKHFIAGETLEESEKAVEHLKQEGLGVVLDYSIETGSGTSEELDKIAQGILATVTAATKDAKPAFACLKVSGLTSFSLLLRLSDIISHNNNSKNVPIPLLVEPTPRKYMPRVLPPAPDSPNPPPLTHEEKLELVELVTRLDIICKEAATNNVAVLFDAEQTYYQPAIDFLALHFSSKYNKSTPIIYNTYQMYLKDGPERLITDINNSKKQGFMLGIKLVRGAYLHSERKRAKKMNYTDPVAPDIDATHANYYKALEIAFANISDVGLMIASHNEDTVFKTMDRLRELNLDTVNHRIQFAQLYGMGDHLSYLLLQHGFRAFKYVPFGPVEHVIPYLIRRMQENRGFIGSASSTERRLLWSELRRRLWFGASSTTSGVITSPRGTL